MTAEQFLSDLCWFIIRRTKPDQIILDKAPNFKATKNEAEMAWEKVVDDPSVHSYHGDLRIKWSFIIELSPWMGGFYKCLVGITNMSLRKSIGRVSLICSYLQIILTKIEALANTRPLVYVNNNQIITPVHFLSINIKTGTPVLIVKNADEKTDPTYHAEEMNTAKKLFESWKTRQIHLQQFWKLWKIPNLLNLREKSQLLNKHLREQSVKEPRIGDIVQVKD